MKLFEREDWPQIQQTLADADLLTACNVKLEVRRIDTKRMDVEFHLYVFLANFSVNAKSLVIYFSEGRTEIPWRSIDKVSLGGFTYKVKGAEYSFMLIKKDY